MVKIPAPAVEPLKITPPIEVEIITITPPSIDIQEIVVEDVVKDTETKLVKNIKTQSKPDITLIPIPKASQKTTLLVSEPDTQPINKQGFKDADVKKLQPATKNQIVLITNDNSGMSTTNRRRDQQQIATAQAQAKSQAQSDRDADVIRQQNLQAAQALAKNKATAQAVIEAANIEKAAQQQAELVLQQQTDAAAKKATEQVAQQAAQKIVSSEPISYGTISKSSWLIEPRLNTIKNKNYNFRGSEISVDVSFIVEVNGKIEDIKITKSSGSNAFNRDFMRALSQAKLRPAMKSSTPIKSIAYLPFRMIL